MRVQLGPASGLTTKFLPRGYASRNVARFRVSKASGLHLHSMASTRSRGAGQSRTGDP